MSAPEWHFACTPEAGVQAIVLADRLDADADAVTIEYVEDGA